MKAVLEGGCWGGRARPSRWGGEILDEEERTALLLSRRSCFPVVFVEGSNLGDDGSGVGLGLGCTGCYMREGREGRKRKEVSFSPK